MPLQDTTKPIALIKIDDQEYPISIDEFKSRFPNTAFAANFNEYQEYGYAEVFVSEQPNYNYNQKIEEITPILTDGVYYQSWNVINFSDTMTPEEYQEFETNYINNLKSQKLAQVQTKKNELRDAGFLVDGVLFDSDIAARVAYSELGMQFMNNTEFSTSWKASNGVWVTMDYELYQKVMIAGKTHIESCFMWQANKEIEINAATTIDDVNAIEI